MPEQTPKLRNLWLLLVAVGLGVIVMLVFILYTSQVQKAAKGEKIRLVRYRHQMDTGDEIRANDLEVVELNKDFEEGLKDAIILGPEDTTETFSKFKLRRDVKRNEWAIWSHFNVGEESLPSRRIKEGYVALPIELDPRRTPGEILRVGGRVNLVGLFSVDGRPVRAYRIIEGVRVQTVGGKGQEKISYSGGGDRWADSGGMRQYRSVGVEIRKEISLQLINVLSHKHGELWLEVCSENDRAERDRRRIWGTINQELQALTEQAATPTAMDEPGF
ncbi:MAG: hypothetical protein ACLFVU_07780 [Phycisphaerae bacterium]